MRLALLAMVLVGCSSRSDPPAPSAEAASAPPSAVPSASSSIPTSEPDRTFALMQVAACAANPPQFFKHVDRGAVEDAAFDFVLEEMKKKVGRPLYAIEREAAETEFAKERGKFLSEWDKDIDRGEKGYLCQWEKISTDGWKIKIRRVGGTSTLTFAERDGGVKLIGYLKDK